MKAYSPNNALIIATEEQISADAKINPNQWQPEEDPPFQYSGTTDVRWEESSTQTYRGEPVFVDERGYRWPLSDLTFAEELPEGEELPDTRPLVKVGESFYRQGAPASNMQSLQRLADLIASVAQAALSRLRQANLFGEEDEPVERLSSRLEVLQSALSQKNYQAEHEIVSGANPVVVAVFSPKDPSELPQKGRSDKAYVHDELTQWSVDQALNAGWPVDGMTGEEMHHYGYYNRATETLHWS